MGKINMRPDRRRSRDANTRRLVIALTCLGVGRAVAQSDSGANSADMGTLAEVVVTAEKKPHPRRRPR